MIFTRNRNRSLSSHVLTTNEAALYSTFGITRGDACEQIDEIDERQMSERTNERASERERESESEEDNIVVSYYDAPFDDDHPCDNR
jgi:hypothetical protein